MNPRTLPLPGEQPQSGDTTAQAPPPPTNTQENRSYAGWLAAMHRDLLRNPVLQVTRAVFQLILAIECSQLALGHLLVERGVLAQEDLSRLTDLNKDPSIREKAVKAARIMARETLDSSRDSLVGKMPPGVTADKFLDGIIALFADKRDEFTVEDTERFFVDIGLDLDTVKSAFSAATDHTRNAERPQ